MQVAQFKNDALRVDHALVFYQIERPAVSTFCDLVSVIPAFMKEAARAACQPGIGKAQEDGEGSQGPCSDDLRCFHNRMDVLYPIWPHHCAGTGRQRCLEERRLFSVAFDQIDMKIFPVVQQDGNHCAGETASRAEIEPPRVRSAPSAVSLPCAITMRMLPTRPESRP